METDVNKGQYSIQLASKISGVGVHTIRAWEKRYKAVTPERNSSGRREYSDSDIERLTLLSELCTLGHSIGKIAGLPTQELKILLEKLGRKADNVEMRQQDLQTAKSPVNVEDSLKSLLMALELYKLDIISHEINKLKLVLNPKQLALDIIAPLLRRVGEQVMEGTYSISQEHALSSILKFHLGHMLFRTNNQKSMKPHRLVICTPEGDFHEFGTLLAALLCSYYQIPYYYLGANLPVESLVDAYRSLESNMVLIGSTVIPENKSIDYVNNYIEKVSRGIGQGEVIIGGNNHIDRKKIERLKNTRFFGNLDDFDNFLRNL